MKISQILEAKTASWSPANWVRQAVEQFRSSGNDVCEMFSDSHTSQLVKDLTELYGRPETIQYHDDDGEDHMEWGFFVDDEVKVTVFYVGDEDELNADGELSYPSDTVQVCVGGGDDFRPNAEHPAPAGKFPWDDVRERPH